MNIICQECNKVLNSFKSLTTHIQFCHNKKEYYDIKKDREGCCKICGEPTEFYSIGYGYYNFVRRSVK